MGAILLAKKGFVPPRAQVELIAGNNRTSIGMALIDAKTKELVINQGAGAPPIDEIMKTAEQFKDRDRLFHFGNDPDPQEEDIQPHVLLDGPNGPVLIVALEGDFNHLKKHVDLCFMHS